VQPPKVRFSNDTHTVDTHHSSVHFSVLSLHHTQHRRWFTRVTVHRSDSTLECNYLKNASRVTHTSIGHTLRCTVTPVNQHSSVAAHLLGNGFVLNRHAFEPLLHFQLVDVSYLRHIQTCSDVFRHVRTRLYDSYIITMKIPWLLGMTHHHVMVIVVTIHVQTCLYMSVNRPMHDSSAFSIYSPLYSAPNQHLNCIHSAVLPQYHFQFYIQPSVKLLTFPTS